MTTGTIISIVLGVAGIIATYLFTKLQMMKNKIDHYFINSYDIGKGLTDVFPQFQLHYGNEVLSKNVKVLQGGFMNTGRNDIGENGKQEDIKIVLPEGCTVKAVKIVRLVSGLVVDPVDNKDDKKNVVIFRVKDIFKTNEGFEYLIITEAPEDIESLKGKISFEHRIKNTKNIQNIYIEQNQNRRKLENLFYVFSAALFGSFLISILCIDRIRTIYFDFFHGAKFMAFTLLFPLLIIEIYCVVYIFGRRNNIISAINNFNKNKE